MSLNRSREKGSHQGLSRGRAVVQRQHHQLLPAETPSGLDRLAICLRSGSEAGGTHEVPELVPYHQMAV